MRRRLCRQPPAATFLMMLFACLALYQMHKANERGIPKKGIVGNLMSDTTKVDLSILPKEYDELSSQSQVCQDRFSQTYLKAFRQSATSYCRDKQPSQLTCFRDSIGPDHVDSFCIAGPAAFLPQTKKFRLYCDLHDFSAGAVDSPPQLEQFPVYCDKTGVGPQISQYFRIKTGQDTPAIDPASDTTGILVTREHSNHDMWHSLLEVMSTYLSIDILRMTKDTNSSTAFFMSDDFNKTQLVILDDIADGPYIDAWKLFATKPVLRLTNLAASQQPTTFKNIITPLPGCSNPFWKGERELLNCHSSPILRAFTARILTAYSIAIKKPHVRDPKSDPEHKETGPPPIQLIFGHHGKSRNHLVNAEKLLTKLHGKYDDSVLQIRSIDFTKHPFATQLRLTHHETDILLGVHDPDLTLGMFLRPGSALIELMPSNLDHKGFHNMVEQLEGIKYHRGNLSDSISTPGLVHGDEDEDEDEDSAGNDKGVKDKKLKNASSKHSVSINETVFVDLVAGVVDDMAKRRGLLIS